MYLDLSLPLSTWSGTASYPTYPTSAARSSPLPRSGGDQAQQSVHQWSDRGARGRRAFEPVGG